MLTAGTAPDNSAASVAPAGIVASWSRSAAVSPTIARRMVNVLPVKVAVGWGLYVVSEQRWSR